MCAVSKYSSIRTHRERIVLSSTKIFEATCNQFNKKISLILMKKAIESDESYRQLRIMYLQFLVLSLQRSILTQEVQCTVLESNFLCFSGQRERERVYPFTVGFLLTTVTLYQIHSSVKPSKFDG